MYYWHAGNRDIPEHVHGVASVARLEGCVGGPQVEPELEPEVERTVVAADDIVSATASASCPAASALSPAAPALEPRVVPLL